MTEQTKQVKPVQSDTGAPPWWVGWGAVYPDESWMGQSTCPGCGFHLPEPGQSIDDLADELEDVGYRPIADRLRDGRMTVAAVLAFLRRQADADIIDICAEPIRILSRARDAIQRCLSTPSQSPDRHECVDGQCLRCHADWDGETPAPEHGMVYEALDVKAHGPSGDWLLVISMNLQRRYPRGRVVLAMDPAEARELHREGRVMGWSP